MSRTHISLVAFALVACVWIPAAQAVTTTWSNIAGGNWSNAGNWNNGVPGAADTVRFTIITPVTVPPTPVPPTGTTIMDLGPSATIGELEIYRYTANNTHTHDLGSNSLTMTNMRLAVDADSAAYRGNLTVNGTAGSALNVTGTLNMATGRGSHSVLTLSPNVALNIGVNPTARGNLYVIENSSVSFASNSATLTPGTTFNAYLNNLYVSNEVADGEFNSNLATFNLSGVTNGIVDVAGDLLIGEGFGARGIMTVSNNVPVEIGVSASSRGRLRIGSGHAKSSGTGVSSLTLGAGTIEAWLTDLSVAHATATSEFATAVNFNSQGLLELTNVSDGFINVAGPVRVGTVVRGTHRLDNASLLTPAQPNNYSPSAIGTMQLGAFEVSATTLTVGDANNIAIFNGVNGTIGRGTLELYGTIFDVSGAVSIDGYNVANSGQVSIEVQGTSSGLLLGAASTLTIGNGSIDITFLAPDAGMYGEYFGLRWEGNHVAELLALGSKLTWDDSAVTASGYDAVSIYFLNGFTFVGTTILPVPEPSSVVLLACGALLIVRRRRKTN